ncbi:MAG: hypothetical protein JNJ57_16805 [Saprospiraceae bacterium]|nr:hypothetical protein [Saprospiraceae bacterium]
MKTSIISFVFFLAAATLLQAQTKKELTGTLNRDLVGYQNATNNLNFDSMMFYMPPAMFDLLPKDSMIASIRKAFDNEYFNMVMGGYKYTKIPKPKKAGNYHCSLIGYEGFITLTYKSESPANAMMGSMMKTQFGKENVEDLADKKGLKIYLKNKKMIAFKAPDVNHWYIVEDKRQEKESMMMDLIIPKEVLKVIGKK